MSGTGSIRSTWIVILFFDKTAPPAPPSQCSYILSPPTLVLVAICINTVSMSG